MLASAIKELANKMELTLNESFSEDAIIMAIADKLKQWIINSPERLFAVLYRLDVSERRVRHVISNFAGEEAAKKIALLIYERQLHKAFLRKQHPASPNPDADLSW